MKTEVNIAVPSHRSVGKRGTAYVLLELFALLARLLGARRLLHRFFLASLIDALLLCLTDQTVVWLARVWHEVPTGAATALIGALLLWLRHTAQPATDGQTLQQQTTGRYSPLWLGAGSGCR